MPQARKTARLHLRKRTGRKPVYVIRDGEHEHSTGQGPEQREEAEKALALYLGQKAARPDRPGDAHTYLIGHALLAYVDDHAEETAAPERIYHAVNALRPFWAERPVSDITEETCKLYRRIRKVSDGTVRRELGTLRAALNRCRDHGRLASVPKVWMPSRPGPKERWMTRDEAAAMIRAARANPTSAHLARFLLVGLYTGTRKDAILNLQWQPNTGGGHVDLENGILYRRSNNSTQTAKRQPPMPIPPNLLAHMKRWRKTSRTHVIEFRGQPMQDIKTVWKNVAVKAGVSGTSPHTTRHTSITWAMQNGAAMSEASKFFGVTMQELERTYWHHHPDYASSVVRALHGRNRSRIRGAA